MNGVLSLRKFVAPEFVFGVDARNLVARYASNFLARNILIVTDPGIIRAGWTADIADNLEAAGINYHIFSDVSCNPHDDEVMVGAEVYEKRQCDSIVAIGGGSPIDCAKGIGIVSSNKKHILSFEGVDQVDKPGPPLICIPTTAGSSADVSQFAIITDTRRKVKIAIISKTLVPDVSLIDPVTATTLTQELTAYTGMDALVHAFEAYVSTANSVVTDLFALEAIRLMSRGLLPAMQSPLDHEIRSRTMLGSLYAGLAFSNASLGAVHALAHALGGFLDLPHGECNAILLSHVVEFNFEAAINRYESIGEAMGLNLKNLNASEKKAAIIGEIDRLRKTLDFGKTLGQLGVTKSDIPALAGKAIKDPCLATNPRRPTVKDLEAIYGRAL
ncbi:MAG TPA: alcohol dehydrogenase-like regulatory protein ErcA [Dissulfurispiraceae bacterium]|nr:alcohol dehydrogenase-like regulatory protein ErcA [Dissulfurispiraceae bacterium]